MHRIYRSALAFFACLTIAVPAAVSAVLPNILWITSEDNGPHLGCYGDEYATTPNLDALAKKGMLYRFAWSNAPVCAPARTTIISGVYPPATGGEHMRSLVRIPDSIKLYPELLRDAGYYCTNNSKEDYNLVKPDGLWDDSSRKAHWKNRDEDQPFFAIFNHTISHESKLRTRPHKQVHDPAKVRVPAYHPDTPEVRQDWAQYYDKITEMDALAGANLKELAEAGLSDDTIVFYYGDHGSGMPRSKRWPYNSGLHVPMLLFIPEKWKHLRPDDYVTGGTSDRLVSFVDLAPTLVSLIGQKPPEFMQGFAFAGKYTSEPQPFIFGFRGRMDERYDLVRSVSDGRFIYIRNFMPHNIYGQYIDYMFKTPTTAKWKEMFDAGELNEAQSRFWQRKPAEELYDLESDPDEVNNLAYLDEHQQTVEQMRKALRRHTLRIRDVGFLPEAELHSRGGEKTPYEVGQDPKLYPIRKMLTAANIASDADRPDPQGKRLQAVLKLLSDDDSGVRYWGAMGLLIRQEAGLKAGHDQLVAALQDPSPSVRVPAAQALGQFGSADDLKLALPVLVELSNSDSNGQIVAMMALNAIDYLDDRAASVKETIRATPSASGAFGGRGKAYISNLVKKTLRDLEE